MYKSSHARPLNAEDAHAFLSSWAVITLDIITVTNFASCGPRTSSKEITLFDGGTQATTSNQVQHGKLLIPLKAIG